MSWIETFELVTKIFKCFHLNIFYSNDSHPKVILNDNSNVSVLNVFLFTYLYSNMQAKWVLSNGHFETQSLDASKLSDRLLFYLFWTWGRGIWILNLSRVKVECNYQSDSNYMEFSIYC